MLLSTIISFIIGCFDAHLVELTEAQTFSLMTPDGKKFCFISAATIRYLLEILMRYENVEIALYVATYHG
jgi:hypothetical protein